MKTCANCRVVKPFTDFAKNSARKDGLQSSCRPCDKTRKDAYYREHVSQFVGYARKNKRRIRAQLKEIKKGLSCSRCGDSRWYVLDFHHRDPKKKEHDVAQLVAKSVSIAKVKAEIARCDVVCSNCHRELHHLERESNAS